MPASADTTARLGIVKWMGVQTGTDYAVVGVDKDDHGKSVLRFAADATWVEFDGETRMDLRPFAEGSDAAKMLARFRADLPPPTDLRSLPASPPGSGSGSGSGSSLVSSLTPQNTPCDMAWALYGVQLTKDCDPPSAGVPAPDACRVSAGGALVEVACPPGRTAQPPPEPAAPSSPAPSASPAAPRQSAPAAPRQPGSRPPLVTNPQQLLDRCKANNCGNIWYQARQNVNYMLDYCGEDSRNYNPGTCAAWKQTIEGPNGDTAWLKTLSRGQCKGCSGYTNFSN
jgi:hypothetical protein